LKLSFLIIFSFIFSNENNFYTIGDSLPSNMPYSKKIFWGEKGIFRTLNIGPNSRIEEMKLRSEMLQMHQKLGLLNLGLMSYQMYLGSEMYSGKHREYGELHKYLGYSTFSIYMTSAGLQFFSPPAFRYSKGYSSMKIHRYLSYLHFVGMVLTPISGYYTAQYPNDEKPYRLHRNIVSVTFSSYTLAFLVTLLP
tara:strand:- start:450 stop:1031 length:582 start_codon:yes stop_codon:yes gene_type:complete